MANPPPRGLLVAVAKERSELAADQETLMLARFTAALEWLEQHPTASEAERRRIAERLPHLEALAELKIRQLVAAAQHALAALGIAAQGEQEAALEIAVPILDALSAGARAQLAGVRLRTALRDRARTRQDPSSLTIKEQA